MLLTDMSVAVTVVHQIPTAEQDATLSSATVMQSHLPQSQWIPVGTGAVDQITAIFIARRPSVAHNSKSALVGV